VGWIAAAVGITASVGLLALRQANTGEVEPGLTAGGFVGWFAFWSGPAIVGAIGAASARREILVGAGLSYVWMGALSFSGVTFVLLVPAVLFLYAGLRDPGHHARVGDRPLLTIAILGLFVASFVGLFGTLQTICWERSADGTVRTHPEVVDGTGAGLSVGAEGVVASGCSGGQVSPTGTAIVIGCLAAAVGLAVLAGARRSRRSETLSTS
jgi:hypothetical protein